MNVDEVNLFLNVPFDLYIAQGRLIDDIAAIMKSAYQFDAKFGTWSLPYNAFKASSTCVLEYPSPYGADWRTLSDISNLSPQYVAGLFPGHASSPTTAPTPTTLAIRAKKSARGVSLAQQQGINSPPSLCHWSIYCWELDYDDIPSPPPEEGDIDLYEPSKRSRWDGNTRAEEFIHRLRDALGFNSFSTINARDIPLARSRIASAAANSLDMLRTEAIGFAIMARNDELLFELLDHDLYEIDLTGLYPFHLAANYLDGSGACCGVLATLVRAAIGRNRIDSLYVNDFGHTVLDSLMMVILKSQTSCTPVMVDERLKKTQRFVAEDVDICGHWDADSHCIRALNAKGSSRVPFSWKHMFCHTSAQTIYHAIPVIFGREYSPDINTPSGLFTKSCSKCDERLVPSPLHTLIITAFYLAQNGCKGENLFGILACLVSLLVHGADPTIRVQMSVGELLGISNETECDHSRLDPIQLGEQVPEPIWSAWTDEVKLG
ncbi:hypothetical protein HD806DRAFT_527127 [Xylariaceae sp. AK1471]|nr:hypothetical protein HD806DRAFT_527127 [Xylariaceae sp. AK1471]